MKFRTELPAISLSEKISLNDKILTIGSCFSSNIGENLAENKFDCLINPYGTIYDPLSITRLLRLALTSDEPGLETMVQSDGVWKNLLLHSSFSGLSVDELSLKIKARTGQVRKQLESAQWLILTLGSAFVYRFKKTDSFIANCQKLPSNQFTKELIGVQELENDFIDFYKLLKKVNPSIKMMLTVSPVRHIRDGLVENSTSKSILRLLAHNLTKELNSTYYYPAYELVLDDLRDYRYYKEDLIHPTDQATKYIWNHFSQTFFEKDSLAFMKQWEKLRYSLNHRPFNPATLEHQYFLKKTLSELEALSADVDLSKEIDFVKDQLLDDQ